jgi:hypothetical protein
MQLVDLGTTVVLDAHNMYEGMNVELVDANGRKKMFAISKIVDNSQIILRPIVGWERFMVWVSDHIVLAALSFAFPIICVIITVLFWKR